MLLWITLPESGLKKEALSSMHKRNCNWSRQKASNDDRENTLHPFQLSQLKSNSFSSRDYSGSSPPHVLRYPIHCPGDSRRSPRNLVDRRLEWVRDEISRSSSVNRRAGDRILNPRVIKQSERRQREKCFEQRREERRKIRRKKASWAFRRKRSAVLPVRHPGSPRATPERTIWV